MAGVQYVHFKINIHEHITDIGSEPGFFDGLGFVNSPNVTIVGKKPGGLTELRLADPNTGSGQGRIFQFGVQSIVTLKDLVIAGGIVSTHGDGAGIYINGGDGATRVVVTLINCIVRDNDATASYDGGGGVWNDKGILTLINSTITRNAARRGGGIWNTGDLYVDLVSFGQSER